MSRLLACRANIRVRILGNLNITVTIHVNQALVFTLTLTLALTLVSLDARKDSFGLRICHLGDMAGLLHILLGLPKCSQWDTDRTSKLMKGGFQVGSSRRLGYRAIVEVESKQ